MTLENSKRLVAHYLEVGNQKAADELIKKYPELSSKPKEEPKEEVKEKPKKKEKK